MDAIVSSRTTRASWSLRPGAGAACIALLFASAPVRADSDEAYRWLQSGNCRQAGDAINDGMARDEPKAFALAGSMYASTCCVEPDLARAARFYQRAVERGDREAREPPRLLYGLGEGVPQDFRLADRWCTYGNRDVVVGDDAIVAGYARTVTTLAHGHVTYPPHATDRVGTGYVAFDAADGTVAFSATAHDGVHPGALFRSTPFTDAIAAAYADADRRVPKVDGIADRNRRFEIPWTFQVK